MQTYNWIYKGFKKIGLTLCTAQFYCISWQGTWLMLCWVSWQRTALYHNVSSCTVSHRRSSHCLSRQESLKNEAVRQGEWASGRVRRKSEIEIEREETRGQTDLSSARDDKQNMSWMRSVTEKLWKDAARRNPRDPYKKHKRYKPHQDRVRETVTARGWHVRHERLQVSKKTSNRHERTERYQLMERQGSVKGRASVAGSRFTLWEWLLSGWRNTIICYQLGSAALNSGTYTLNTVHMHAHTHTPCRQHAGLSPYPRRDLHTPCTAPGCSMGHFLRTGKRNTMFTVWTKRGRREGKGVSSKHKRQGVLDL